MKSVALMGLACALAAGPAFALPVISSVTITKDGTGKGTVSAPGGQSCAPSQPQCGFSYVGSFTEQLTATPGAGSVFVEWTGCDSTAGNVCSVSVGDAQGANKQVTASFMLGPTFPDFSADGKPDLVWRHAPSGATLLWRMNGLSMLSDAFIATVDPAWKLIGVADFNGDGYSDLVWRDGASGATILWLMNGPSLLSAVYLFTLPADWVFVGIADFNKDGKPDFLMRSPVGNAFVWFFDGSVPGDIQVLFRMDPSWRVDGFGDFDGDGQPDFLFRHATNGLAFVQFTHYQAGGSLGLGHSSQPFFGLDPAWEVVQIADWNGDGSPDILFRNRDSGIVFVWYLTGMTVVGGEFVIQVDPAWELAPQK